jgi:opacity protein-like surface antigen
MKLIKLLPVLLINLTAINAQEVPKRDSTKNKIFIGGSFSLDRTSAQSFLPSPTFGYSFGLNAGKFVSKRIELSLGLAYSSLNTKDDFYVQILNPQQGFVNTDTLITLLQRNRFTDLSVKCKLHFIKKSKFSSYFMVGLAPSYYIHAKSSAYESVGSGSKKLISSSIYNYDQKIVLNFSLGLGIDYNLSETIKLSLTPQYRSYRSKILNKTGPGFNAFGVGLGIAISL